MKDDANHSGSPFEVCVEKATKSSSLLPILNAIGSEQSPAAADADKAKLYFEVYARVSCWHNHHHRSIGGLKMQIVRLESLSFTRPF